MANRQIEIRVVNVSYTPATSPEDAAMARAGISLLLKMMVKAKAMAKKDEVTGIDLENNPNEGSIASCSAEKIAICKKVTQSEVTYAGVIGHDTSTDSLSV